MSVEIMEGFYQGYNNVSPKAHSWPLVQTLILVLTKIINFVTLSSRQNVYGGKETGKENGKKIKNKEWESKKHQSCQRSSRTDKALLKFWNIARLTAFLLEQKRVGREISMPWQYLFSHFRFATTWEIFVKIV